MSNLIRGLLDVPKAYRKSRLAKTRAGTLVGEDFNDFPLRKDIFHDEIKSGHAHDERPSLADCTSEVELKRSLHRAMMRNLI